MQTAEWLQVLIEPALAYLLFFSFVVVGRVVLTKGFPQFNKQSPSPYNRCFWWFIAGLFIIISIYSIVITKGRTVNILVLPVLYFLFKTGDTSLPEMSPIDHGQKHRLPFLELGFIAFVSVFILHLFPESEYKQSDSFFYLKIAESLNATGQENVSHYANLFSSAFAGMEPYHYFELWLTAFITRFTEAFLPSINVERFITHSILLMAIIIGLYQLVETFIRQKISLVQKIFCWSLLFILPNLLHFFPALYRLFISDFEGNLLERPNFRIIYLLLIPVITEVHRRQSVTNRSIYLLLLLSVVSFKCTVVILPSLLLYGAWQLIKKDPAHRLIWIPVAIFSVAFAALYKLFPANRIPSFYNADLFAFLLQTVRGWKFIAYSIATSVLYIVLLSALFVLPLLVIYRNDLAVLWQKFKRANLLFVIIGAVGLVMARVLYLKDNAYQFLFIAHILVTLFIWLSYFIVLSHSKSFKAYIFASGFISCLWFIQMLNPAERPANTFAQNGKFVYDGIGYSAGYLEQVQKFFAAVRPAAGGYFADTTFYKSLYYSRRNPNVYFLPITYIVAAAHNRNIEFCLSDTAAINYQVENPVHKDYLRNAIDRSYFVQYSVQNPGLPHMALLKKFIADNRLSYLIVTKNCQIAELSSLIKKEIADPNTGERFIIL